MMPTPRRPEHGSDGHDPFGLHVFVPGVMGAGIMVSLVVIAADALRAHGLRRSARRPAQVVGTKLAADVLRIPPERLCKVRRRPLVYRIIGSGFCAVAGYTLVGSFWNFINPSPGLHFPPLQGARPPAEQPSCLAVGRILFRGPLRDNRRSGLGREMLSLP